MDTSKLHKYVLDKFKNEAPHVLYEGESILNMQRPERYGNLEKVDLNVENHECCDYDDWVQYFDAVKNEGIRICIINGFPASIYALDSIYCDYCGSSIEPSSGHIEYYYCNTCKIDMCELCFMETDEDIAIKNGALNYNLRKDKLAQCRKHLLIKRNIPIPNDCDICSTTITADYYSNNDVKVCVKCAQTPEGSGLISSNRLEVVKCEYAMDKLEFGSMLDWVPIVKDEEYDLILMNLNPDSLHYKQLCLCAADNHGRSGYFTLSKDITLDDVLKRIKYYTENSVNNDRPIIAYMIENNMPVYYG